MKIMRAYVLVNAKMGKVRDVAQKIASLAGVKLANACWGVSDVFVVAEVANSAELDQLVIDKIQALEGVERTETHIAID
jgi:DNA-binding Lrp family transcriptional regulator